MIWSYLHKDGVVTSTVNPNITLQGIKCWSTNIKVNIQLSFSLMMGYLPSQVQLDALSYMKPRFFTGIRPFEDRMRSFQSKQRKWKS